MTIVHRKIVVYIAKFFGFPLLLLLPSDVFLSMEFVDKKESNNFSDHQFNTAIKFVKIPKSFFLYTYLHSDTPSPQGKIA